MSTVELRDADAARGWLLQGLWLQRVRVPTADTVRPTLRWALEVASNGAPLPPVGFVADLGAVALGLDGGKLAAHLPDVPGWPSGVARAYEDHLLAKLYADWTFERASDALRRYTADERPRGLAYLVRQFRERAKLGGVELSPAVIRGMIAQDPADLLREGYERLDRDRPLPLLVEQYEALASAARRTAEFLEPEDVLALEQRTALADMGQYVAHRQILHVAARIAERLPARPVGPQPGRREVPTRVAAEDEYPVGGYSSIATRGSIESLLHSQLAYMEEDEPPDLFDVKFVRDELFYYSRDENRFLRRRRAFAFNLDPALAGARVKDPELPCQRIVLAVAAVLVLVRTLADWLTTDSCRFEVLLPGGGKPTPLANEGELLELLLTDLRATKAAAVLRAGGPDAGGVELPATADDVAARARGLAEAAQTHLLTVGPADGWREIDGVVHTVLGVQAAEPTLTDGFGRPQELVGDDPFEKWVDAVRRILHLCV